MAVLVVPVILLPRYFKANSHLEKGRVFTACCEMSWYCDQTSQFILISHTNKPEHCLSPVEDAQQGIEPSLDPWDTTPLEPWRFILSSFFLKRKKGIIPVYGAKVEWSGVQFYMQDRHETSWRWFYKADKLNRSHAVNIQYYIKLSVCITNAKAQAENQEQD